MFLFEGTFSMFSVGFVVFRRFVTFLRGARRVEYFFFAKRLLQMPLLWMKAIALGERNPSSLVTDGIIIKSS